MSKHYEQFLRVKRWYKRLEDLKESNKHLDDLEDFLYAFFQNCFHLKDWIIESGVLSRDIVNTFIESNTDMKICRDLCIDSKHLNIRNSSIDSNISVSRSNCFVSIGGSIPKIEIPYFIHVKGYTPLDAFALAGSCVVNWQGFLGKHNLLE